MNSPSNINISLCNSAVSDHDTIRNLVRRFSESTEETTLADSEDSFFKFNKNRLFRKNIYRRIKPSSRRKQRFGTQKPRRKSIFSQNKDEFQRKTSQESIGTVKFIDLDGESNSFEKDFTKEEAKFVTDREEVLLLSLREASKARLEDNWTLKDSKVLFLVKDFTLFIELDKIFVKIEEAELGLKVTLRRGFKEFFAFVKERFNLVVYTACTEATMQAVFEQIDDFKFNYLFGREHCRKVRLSQGQLYYTKDLQLFHCLDRDNLLILDSSPVSFLSDLDNGVVVSEFDDSDELFCLREYIQVLLEMPGTLRENNRNTLKFKQLAESIK